MIVYIGPAVAGFLFAVGLGLSGMTHPEKIIGFLDFTGAWDPTLAFVMAAAVGAYALLSRAIARRAAPLFARSFSLPTRRDLDPRLITGAALFGVGWGLAGLCPGPSLVALLSFNPAVWAFVGSMLAGMVLFEQRSRARAKESPSGAVTAPTSQPSATARSDG